VQISVPKLLLPSLATDGRVAVLAMEATENTRVFALDRVVTAQSRERILPFLLRF
jgi:hypothetical protein